MCPRPVTNGMETLRQAQGKKIFILLGHSDTETFSGALAECYEKGAREGGHDVRRTNLGETSFDPILHKGYKEIQELEPDLIKIQRDINWADHLVIVYPNWWNTMPAILKGMFDRIFLPGFAFNFNKKTGKVLQLLKVKSARVIIISGTFHPLYIRFHFGDFTNEISKGILGFCGISPVSVTTFGPAQQVTDQKRETWKKKVYDLGKKAA